MTKARLMELNGRFGARCGWIYKDGNPGFQVTFIEFGWHIAADGKFTAAAHMLGFDGMMYSMDMDKFIKNFRRK